MAKGDPMDILSLLQASPARGVVADKPLDHWHELLEEWCMVHERYCRMTFGDAIFWQSERSNLAALAGAAWRAGWAALEEFSHEKIVKRSKFSGRADLFLRTPVSEDYIESKLVWCREGSKQRCAWTVKGMRSACDDARALHLEKRKGIQRIGVVFVVPSLRKGDRRELSSALAAFFETVNSVGVDAAAWCFPPIARHLGQDGRVYSGVILLAKKA
jgi:hypothetical protein